MAIWGKNGLIRKQEVALAKKLLAWKFKNSSMALPNETTISAHAEKIVADAHKMATERGCNVLEIIKDKVNDFKKNL